MNKSLLRRTQNKLRKKKFINEIKKGRMFHGIDNIIHILIHLDEKFVYGTSVRDHSQYRYELNQVYIIRHQKKVMLSTIKLGFKDLFLLFIK